MMRPLVMRALAALLLLSCGSALAQFAPSFNAPPRYTAASPAITGGTITGATINNSVIGNVTPVAGNFTTLGATGTITGGGATPFTSSSSQSSMVSELINASTSGYTSWTSTNNSGKIIRLLMLGSAASGFASIGSGSGAVLSDSSVSLILGTQAGTPIQLVTNSQEQVRILNTASASRYVTLTGSNGGTVDVDSSAGPIGIGRSVASGVQLGGSTALTLTAGAVGIPKITASGTAPGATGGKIELVCGTNAGSAKLIAVAGTSSTAVTILDNIGSGVTGC